MEGESGLRTIKDFLQTMVSESRTATARKYIANDADITEGVIELLSHRDDRASRIISSFVVGDRNNETQTQR
ncbi:hypothetical protein ACFQKC_02325, partial [Halovenus rubra]